jgi:hypothetical protein
MMMAAVEMLYGLFSGSRSFWDAPEAIWAWVGGIDHFTRNHPGSHVGPIVLGIGGHMMNSMVVGMVFAALITAARIREPITTAMLGVAAGIGMWVLMRYGILPLNHGESKLFTTGIVSPQWTWWVAHVAFGMGLGLGYVAARTPRAARRPVRTEAPHPA